MKSSLLCLVFVAVADAFTTPMSNNKMVSSAAGRMTSSSRVFSTFRDQEKDYEPVVEEHADGSKYFNSISVVSTAFWLLSSTAANAAGPDWGKLFRELRVQP